MQIRNRCLRTTAASASVLALTLFGCGDEGTETDTDTGTELGTNTDSDTDAETDIDTDTETDLGTDTDADTGEEEIENGDGEEES